MPSNIIPAIIHFGGKDHVVWKVESWSVTKTKNGQDRIRRHATKYMELVNYPGYTPIGVQAVDRFGNGGLLLTVPVCQENRKISIMKAADNFTAPLKWYVKNEEIARSTKFVIEADFNLREEEGEQKEGTPGDKEVTSEKENVPVPVQKESIAEN